MTETVTIPAKALQALQRMVDTQSSTGNWNHDPYMLGMANGLELALATLQDRKPNYLSAPDRWLTDNPLYLIEAERQRQKEVEHWSDEHDDQHKCGEMAKAAACYAYVAALSDTVRDVDRLPPVNAVGPVQSQVVVIQRAWPWDWKWWKPKDRVRDLVRAGALIVAELERLKRAEMRLYGAGAAGTPQQETVA